MVTIKKSGRILQVDNNDFMALQDTSDGMYFKFKDGAEYRILCDVTPQVKAVSSILMNSRAKNIIIDFDARNMIQIVG
jgi:hypothetical protein